MVFVSLLWYNKHNIINWAEYIIKQKGRLKMDITYNKLFKLLIDKHLNKTEFAKMVGISTNTLAKLSKNEYVSMEILVRICRKLDCAIGNIVEILPENQR